MARPRVATIDRATTDRLLDGAELHFGRDGYSGARLEDIAREAGISRPSLLYHFKTKEDLYKAVVGRAFEQLGEALSEAIIAKGDFPRRLDALVCGYLAFLDQHPAIAQVVLREFLSPSDMGRSLVVGQIRPLLDLLVRFVREEGRDHVRPDLPVRDGIMQVAMSALVRSGCGEFREPLWGDSDETPRLARILFLGGLQA